MKQTDQFIRHATRGLWGNKKRDAALELRSAIEDKIYRHQLCGMDSADAERAALRDLGSPHAIARDLSRVNTAPAAIRATLLLGVAGLLSLQAVAQIPAVGASPWPKAQTACTFDEAMLSALPAAQAGPLRQALADPTRRQALIDQCQQMSPVPGNHLLRLPDLLQAFRAAGIGVQDMTDGRGFVYTLSFPGQPDLQTVSFDYSVRQVKGTPHIDIISFVQRLREATTVPLTISGLVNPTLSFGPARIQLGTPATPVLASNVYLSLVFDQVITPLNAATGKSNPLVMISEEGSTPVQRYAVALNAPDGTLYGLLSNEDLLTPCHCPQDVNPMYSLRVRSTQGGQIPIEHGQTATRPVAVTTLPELVQATRRGRHAVLAYRLNGRNLRHLTLTPVPAAHVRVVQP